MSLIAFMPNPNEGEPGIIAVGGKVVLRDRREKDTDRFIFWQTHGEWLKYDAPWERDRAHLSADDELRIGERFAASCSEGLLLLRRRAMICSLDGCLIGFVNRYPHERFPDLFMIGASVCEDEFLNLGYGTEALQLWVNHLFANSSVHRVGAATWSFNPRAIALLKKLHFTHEGTERELHHWNGQWHDRLSFGILRQEWEENRKAGT
jgi:RimJ/RimL family protein N-acetyltransferase